MYEGPSLGRRFGVSLVALFMRWLFKILQLRQALLLAGALLLGLPGRAQVSPVPVTAPPDSANSANAKPPFIFGAYVQGAIIARHTGPIAHLVDSHPTGFELNVQRQTTGAAP